MLNDLVAGNRLEAPWLSGAVARMAEGSGVAGAGQRDDLRGGRSRIATARATDYLTRGSTIDDDLLLVWLINAVALLALPYLMSVDQGRFVRRRADRGAGARA